MSPLNLSSRLAFLTARFFRFFAAFDTDRPSLLSAYAPVCSFSFYTDTSYPLRSRAKKIGSHGDKRMPNQHKLDWKSYLTSDGSRNLARVKYPGPYFHVLCQSQH